jgi:hypothetical protein
MTDIRRSVFISAAAILMLSCGGGGGSPSGSQGNGSQDTTPPVVLSTNPSNLASGVPVNAQVTATFNENITAVAPSTALTLTQGGTTVPGTVSCSGGTATFTPTAKFGNNLSYSAIVTTGFKDLAGNALASPFTWSFITSDCNAITLIKQFSLNLGSAALNTGFKASATDGTSIYLWTQTDFSATSGTVFKIDPTNGTILSTTVLPLVANTASTPVHGIQFIADIAWHNGSLWASGTYLAQNGSLQQGVFRVNLSTGLSEAQLPVAGGLAGETPILQGLASDGTNLYAAIDRNYAYPTAVAHVIVKFTPASSVQVPLSPALLTTAGQAIRLDFGGGSLWVFNNPNFQQVEPVSGVVLANYCKTDGGGNILYFNSNIWSIKDTILMAYSLQ